MTTIAKAAPRSIEMPHSEMAERCLVGSILLFEDEAWAEDVPALVAPSDFFTDEHRALFRVEVSLHEQGIPITIPTVCDEFRTRGWVEQIDRLTGGMEVYLVELCGANWNLSGIGFSSAWARMIRKYAVQRAQFQQGMELIRGALEPATVGRKGMEISL